MKKRFFPQNNSVAFIWMLSYIAVLLVPMILNFVAYLVTQKSLTDQVYQLNIKMLQSVTAKMDDAISLGEKISSGFELNDSFKQFLRLEGKNEKERVVALAKTSKELAVNKVNYLYDNMYIYLYIERYDLVVTPGGACTSKEFYDIYIDKDVSYEEWKKMNSSGNTERIWNVRADLFGQTEEMIVYSRPMIINYFPNETVVVCIAHNMDLYGKEVEQIPFMKQGHSVIIDKNSKILYKSDSFKLDEKLLKYDTYEHRQGNFSVKVNNDKYLINYFTSGVFEWKYIIVVPKSIFYKKSNLILILWSVLFVIMALAGLMVIRFLIRKNYTPVKGLTKLFNLSGQCETNEFDFLKSEIEKKLNENINLSLQIEKQLSIVQQSYLCKLLDGKVYYDAATDQVLESMNIKFPYSSYMIAMVYVEDYGEFFEDSKLNSREQMDLVDLVFTNIMEETFNENHVCKMVKKNDNLFCVINSDSFDEQEILKLFEKVKELIEEQFKILFTVAVSSVNYGYAGIHAGYEQTIEEIEYRVLFDNTGIISYSQINDYNMNPKDILEYNENILAGFIANGDTESLVQYLDRLFDENAKLSSPKVLRCLLYEIINSVLHLLKDNNVELEKYNIFQDELLNLTEEMYTITEYKKCFRELIPQIMTLLSETSGKDDLVEEIKAYIQNNYADISLTVSTIAEAFHLSNGHISKRFKKETNECLSTYINIVRIEKSKLLLTETEMYIEEICMKVGFTNKVTFLRVFKKIEGITPTQYREYMKKN